MTTIHLQVAPRVGPTVPRGARLAADAMLFLSRAWQGLFMVAPPAAAAPEEDARAVRELALQYQQSDPNFAADLMAAADRHERLNGVN